MTLTLILLWSNGTRIDYCLVGWPNGSGSNNLCGSIDSSGGFRDNCTIILAFAIWFGRIGGEAKGFCGIDFML